MEKSGSTTVDYDLSISNFLSKRGIILKWQNNKQILPNVLQIISFSQDRGLIEYGAFGPQAEEADITMVS